MSRDISTTTGYVFYTDFKWSYNLGEKHRFEGKAIVVRYTSITNEFHLYAISELPKPLLQARLQ